MPRMEPQGIAAEHAHRASAPAAPRSGADDGSVSGLVAPRIAFPDIVQWPVTRFIATYRCGGSAGLNQTDFTSFPTLSLAVCASFATLWRVACECAHRWDELPVEARIIPEYSYLISRTDAYCARTI